MRGAFLPFPAIPSHLRRLVGGNAIPPSTHPPLTTGTSGKATPGASFIARARASA